MSELWSRICHHTRLILLMRTSQSARLHAARDLIELERLQRIW